MVEADQLAIYTVKELNSGLLRTNPDSSRVEDLNQGPSDFKASALNHLGMLPPSPSPYMQGSRSIACEQAHLFG